MRFDPLGNMYVSAQNSKIRSVVIANKEIVLTFACEIAAETVTVRQLEEIFAAQVIGKATHSIQLELFEL